MNKTYFKLMGLNDQVVYGRISLWNGELPEGYADMQPEEKEAYKPTEYRLIRFSKSKTNTIKVVVKEYTGLETTLSDAFNQVIAHARNDLKFTSGSYSIKTSITEADQAFIDETMGAEVKASKELFDKFQELEYI